MAYQLNIGSDVEIANRAIAVLEKELGAIVFTEGAFWFYSRTEWQVLLDNTIFKVIHTFDGAHYGGGKVPETVKLGDRKIDSIFKQMRVLVEKLDFFAIGTAGINCRNGFVQFDHEGVASLAPHDREHRCRHTIQADWKPDVELAGSLFSQYLDVLLDTIEDEARDDIGVLFQQIAGAAVGGLGGARLKQPRAFIFYGRSANNGKSQFLHLLRSLVPPNAVSSVSPASFGEPSYVVSLVGKYLNTADELSSAQAVASDRFKAIVTGEPIQARDLYKSVISFRAQAVHIFATQRLPSFVGGLDQGVRRRLALVNFERSIPQEKMKLGIVEAIIETEMDLILSWAIAGARRLIKNRRYDVPVSVESAMDAWLQESDPVSAMCAARVRTDRPELTGYTEFGVYSAIRNWCEHNGGYRPNHIPSKAECLNRFYELFPQSRGKRTASSKRVIHGIRIMASDFGDEDGISDTEKVVDISTGELSHTIYIRNPDNANQPVY